MTIILLLSLIAAIVGLKHEYNKGKESHDA